MTIPAPISTEEPTPAAVLYLRVSTTEQAGRDGAAEGLSIPAQREACQRKAEALGAVVAAEFVDRGESARSAQRPQLKQLLQHVKENPVAFVIVHKVDRLARNRADDIEITLAIRASGATLVSCTENIDETPSGLLMHGIMSSIAEFYSRNLASEVMKGLVQKAKNGGTVGKAPLGYLNVRKTENGREIRTVTVDPARGPLITWAFEAYASGDWSLQLLLAELTRRGLETTGSAKRPAGPLYTSHLHKLLGHPYYKGLIRYQGIDYPGRHQPLVSPDTWQRVQEVLKAHNLAGEKQREHNHYLKGSVYCQRCKSRLIITHARSRSGRIYPYFVCVGRHRKRTNCTFKAVLIDNVEQQVIEHYAHHQLTPDLRELISQTLTAELAVFRQEAAAEREQLEKHRQKLLNQRTKLLQAHYAEAIPLDLFKQEQDRIRDQLAAVEDRLVATEAHQATVDNHLQQALRLATNTQTAYRQAPPALRRLFNQAFFKHLYISDTGDIASDPAPPFDIILGHDIRTLATTPRNKRRKHPPPHQPTRATPRQRARQDHVLTGAPPTRPTHNRGLNYDTMVRPAGFEPATRGLEVRRSVH